MPLISQTIWIVLYVACQRKEIDGQTFVLVQVHVYFRRWETASKTDGLKRFRGVRYWSIASRQSYALYCMYVSGSGTGVLMCTRVMMYDGQTLYTSTLDAASKTDGLKKDLEEAVKGRSPVF
jgi:hypothetical protein